MSSKYSIKKNHIKFFSCLISFISITNFFTLSNIKGQSNYELETNNINVGLEISPQRMYLWHAIPIDKGFVIQPDFWISYKNFTIELWGNWVLFDKSTYDTLKNHELDIYLYYSFNINDFIEITPCLNYYNYIEQDENHNTLELSTKFNFYITKNITFANEIFMDIYNYKNVIYSSHSIEYMIDLDNNYAYKINVECGYGNKKFFNIYYDLSLSSINYLKLYSGINYNISSNLKITPFIEYNRILIRDIINLIGNNFINIGAKLQIEF